MTSDVGLGGGCGGSGRFKVKREGGRGETCCGEREKDEDDFHCGSNRMGGRGAAFE